MKKNIKGDGFTLRPFKKGDEHSLQKNANNKKIAKFVGEEFPSPYTVKDAKDWINLQLKNWRSKNNKEVVFAIDVNGDVVGSIGLHVKQKHKAEIGYWLGEGYWGSGIMTKALKLMTNYGFSSLKLSRIYGKVFSDNKASMRVLEKGGYKLEGILRKNSKYKGKLIDDYIFAKVK